jgi:hypothetical protein
MIASIGWSATIASIQRFRYLAIAGSSMWRVPPDCP